MGFGKDGKGVILHEQVAITLGALADQAAVLGDANYVLQEDFRVIKTEWGASMGAHTAGEGPMVLFLCDGELQAVEAAQALVAEPLDANDNVANERSMRPVFPMGFLSGNGTTDFLRRDDGALAEKTVRWTFSNPEGWNWGAVNVSGGILTTGTVIVVYAKHYGVWVK